MGELFGRFSSTIDSLFGPILRPLFHPTNAMFTAIPEEAAPAIAKAAAVALFVGAMIWVWVGLRRQYVNLDAPTASIRHDLRFWTILSMAPHVIVYLYF